MSGPEPGEARTLPPDHELLIGMLCEADVPHSYESFAEKAEDLVDDDIVTAVEITGIARFEFDEQTGGLLRVTAGGYRALLAKYMRHASIAGADADYFVTDAQRAFNREHCGVEFTDAEWAELQRIAQEAGR